MKRSSLPFLLAAIIAVLVGFSYEHDPSLDHDSFEAKFRSSVRKAGFDILTEVSLGTDALALPLTVQLHPRRLRGTSGMPSQFPDGTVRYGVARRGSFKMDCYVRYLEGRAQLLEIRTDRTGAVDASDLCLALRQGFGEFPVRIREGK